MGGRGEGKRLAGGSLCSVQARLRYMRYGAVNQSDGKVEKSHSPLSSNSSPAETLKSREAGSPHLVSSGHRWQPRSLGDWKNTFFIFFYFFPSLLVIGADMQGCHVLLSPMTTKSEY